jgi:two-component system sensor histidine kinase YesM
MLLQPIVENAIQHGFSARPHNPVIELDAILDNDTLEIRISDNGKGMSGDMIERLSRRLLGVDDETQWMEKGVGLVNTARRLQVLFGYKARLAMEQRESGGMTFTLYIPATERKEALPHDDPNANR